MAREYVATGTASFKASFDSVPTKGRPRFSAGMRKPRTPEATNLAEERIRWAFSQRTGDRRVRHEGPVAVRINVDKRLPNSAPKRDEGKAQTEAPDIDNICKVVLDALNGLAYVDDRQVVSLTASKLPKVHRRQGPRVEITVTVTYIEEVGDLAIG